MGDTVGLYETMTGRVLSWPRVIDYSWEHGLNDNEGSVSVTLPTSEVFEVTTRPWQYSLAVVSEQGDVLAAGPIYKREVDVAAGTVQLNAGSFWSLVKKRFWSKPGQPVVTSGRWATRVTDGSVTTFRKQYSGSMDGLVFIILREQLSDLPGVNESRFFHYAGSHTRTPDGLEMQMTSDVVTNLFQADSPALVRFDATFDGERFEWIGRSLTGTRPATWLFSLDSPTGIVTNWRITEDAGTQVNRCFQVSKIAKGQEDKTPDASLFARWDARQSVMPWLDVVDSSHENVTTPATLGSYAKGIAASSPYYAFAFDVQKSAVTASGTTTSIADAMRPGDWCIISASDSFYGASTFAGRIEKLSGNRETLGVSVERVTRYDGYPDAPTPNDGVMQMPANTAEQRIKNFGLFTRRANNPVLGGA